MIERFYLKNNLSFDEVNLEFQKGLIVFTGPSGSGKSVLFESFLSIFGLKEAKADICEVTLKNEMINYENFSIEAGDDIVIKELKKEKIRFFLNNQNISKNALSEFSKDFMKYLHLKDASEFDNINLLKMADKVATKSKPEFVNIKLDFELIFSKYQKISKELQKISQDESKIEELKEFLAFEIKKISDINPKIGEYEKLQEMKKQLSKKEKILQSINNCNQFFELSQKVTTALALLEVDSSFFDATQNELISIFENQKDKLNELDELNVESMLDRIEKLSNLGKRYGSIEEALVFLKTKQDEFEKLNNISFEKKQLQKELATIEAEVFFLAAELTKYRKISIKEIENKTNEYLKSLFLDDCQFEITSCELGYMGVDKINIAFGTKNFDKLSSGEFNRLRLSYLSAISSLVQSNGGILFLDEIDANLSGKESFAISKVLKELSKSYQVFAISHQPQLTSNANQHFLVTKENGISEVKNLDLNERVEEISRMISLDVIGDDARKYAINLLKENGQWQK